MPRNVLSLVHFTNYYCISELTKSAQPHTDNSLHSRHANRARKYILHLNKMNVNCHYCGLFMPRTALFRHLKQEHRGVQNQPPPIRPQVIRGQPVKRDQKRNRDQNRDEQENQEAPKRKQIRRAPTRLKPSQTVTSMSLQGETVHTQAINFLHRQHAMFRSEMQSRGIPPSELPLLNIVHQKPDELEAVLQYKGNTLHLYKWSINRHISNG